MTKAVDRVSQQGNIKKPSPDRRGLGEVSILNSVTSARHTEPCFRGLPMMHGMIS